MRHCCIWHKCLPLHKIRTMHQIFQKYADQLGITASALCLVHCLLMPVLLAFWAHEEAAHFGHAHHLHDGHAHDHAHLSLAGIGFDYFFLAFSAMAIWLASRSCLVGWIKAGLWICLGLLAVGILSESFWGMGHWITYPAALGLIVLHVYNWRHGLVCRSEHSHQSPKSSSSAVADSQPMQEFVVLEEVK